MNNLKQQIEKFIPSNEQEEKDKKIILDFIETFPDVLTRNNKFGHLTASAFVVDENLTKTLLVHHNILNGFIYPGGHADGEKDLLKVAIREVLEETGIVVTPLIDEIFSIIAAPTKGHIKRGEYVPAHIHYDILYLLVANKSDMNKIRVLEDENSIVKWVDLENSYNEEVVDWVRPVNEKIVKKIKCLYK